MTSLHKMIAIILIWIVCGGVLAVLISRTAVFPMDTAPFVLIVSLILGAATVATYFITRSTDVGKAGY